MLDAEVLASLAGEMQVSMESARMLVDEAGVTAEDLESEPARILWRVLEGRIRERRGFDVGSILRHIDKQPEVRALADDVLFRRELGTLVDRLEEAKVASVRRAVLDGLRAAGVALKDGAPLAQVASLARDVMPLFERVRGRVRETSGDTIAIFDAAAQAWENKQPASVRTGWTEFDTALRLVPQLHAIGAQPGAGKSAMVAGLVRQWTAAHVKVGVLAYEDDALDLQRRMLACDAGLTLGHMQGDVVPEVYQQAATMDAAEKRQHLEKYLLADDAGRGTINDALSSIRQMHSRGCRVVLLDNLTCVRLDTEDDERHHAIEEALLRIREAAIALRMPVIVIGHLKRGQSEADELHKVPKLSDFAGAAAWDRTCRSALGMWREKGTNGGADQTVMKILKQTNGESQVEFNIEMRWSAATVIGITRRDTSAGMQTKAGRYA